MPNLHNPSLYQINTRVWVNQISKTLRKKASLDDIPDEELETISNQGFDWVYLLGVWQFSQIGQQMSRSNPEWRKEYTLLLPDLQEEDICGSCFAITGYTVDPKPGGNEALMRLRQRLNEKGMGLMLDFIPNHTAIDHPWVKENPQFYIIGTESQLQHESRNYVKLQTSQGDLILAHGRDPYFPGWSDTLQLNFGNPAVQEAMLAELMKVARVCDGVRCDMAMLVIPEIFQSTWGITAQPFWPWAIESIRQEYPKFTFLAEVYWDLEQTLQEEGFDYTYDKRLYDRLIDQHALPVRDELKASTSYQRKLARFLENHDERRAAVVFPHEIHKAAATITYLLPGMRFFHQGQLVGFKVKLPIQLCRSPKEPWDPILRMFYAGLLKCTQLPAIHHGEWQLIDPIPAWEGNWTWENFVVFTWQESGGQRLLVIVNYSPHQSQCYIRLPFPDLRGGLFRLQDQMGLSSYNRDGNSLLDPGLYVDIPEWGYHVLEILKL